MLARATHKTKREIEELVAELAPKPGVPSTIRKRPERKASSNPLGPPSAPNLYMAELDYGKEKMDAYRGSADRVREPAPSFQLFPGTVPVDGSPPRRVSV